jgi:hypothetical protein
MYGTLGFRAPCKDAVPRDSFLGSVANPGRREMTGAIRPTPRPPAAMTVAVPQQAPQLPALRQAASQQPVPIVDNMWIWATALRATPTKNGDYALCEAPNVPETVKGTRVRLYYPMERLEGQVWMRRLDVDKQARLSWKWVCLHAPGIAYIGEFE